MMESLIIYLLIAVVSLAGVIGYRMGRLSSEVKQHNRMLTEIQKALEKLITGGGEGKNGE